MGPRFSALRKKFSHDQLRAQIGKGSDKYLPEFLGRNEMKRFGKELDEYRSDLFKKEYLPQVQPFPRVRELFQRLRADDKPAVLATSGKEEETRHYTKLIGIEDLIAGLRETKTVAGL